MKKEYRSAARSKRLIREAFMKLLKEKELEKITVTDIVKQADINRSTFYAHYPDVQGLLEELENEIIDSTMEILNETSYVNIIKDPYPALSAIGRTIEEKQDFYKILMMTNGAIRYEEELTEYFVQQIANSPEFPNSIRKSPYFALRVSFFAGGIVSAYKQWLKGEVTCSLDEISEDVGRLILASAKGVIEKEWLEALGIDEE